jgi:hypothetical protein
LDFLEALGGGIDDREGRYSFSSLHFELVSVHVVQLGATDVHNVFIGGVEEHYANKAAGGHHHENS